MSLTLGTGPLASHTPGHLNFSLEEAPKHRILFEDFPRRMRALVDNHTILDTTRGTLLHESNILPKLYFPLEDLDRDVLVDSDHTSHCPFKGDASYYSVDLGDRLLENAVWYYPSPIAAAPWLEGYASLYEEAADLWLQEDEPVHGHLRDPYHRVDVLESSRRAKVTVGGTEIAESDRPKLLFETGLAPRVYLLRADVLPGILEQTETTTVCPYKGDATYWTVRVGDTEVVDGAWSYETALPEALKVAGHLCFDGEGIEVTLD